MKFAKELQASGLADDSELGADGEAGLQLHALYKQLKKSLRIIEGPPSDQSSAALPDGQSSDDDEEDGGGVAPMAADRASPARQPLPQQAGEQQQQQQLVQPPGAAAAGGDAASVQQQQQQQAQQQQQQQQQAQLQEARFVALVEQCVQRLNEDYLSKEETLVIKADLAAQAAADAGSREARLAAYKGVVNVHGELVLLCHWSMVAYTGLVKILKKHHKRTGQRVHSVLLSNLLSQPFCCLEEVRGLVRSAEQQLAELTELLGLPPPAAHAAGAAAAAAVRDPSAQPQPVAALARRSPAVVGESGQEDVACAAPSAGVPQQPPPVAVVAACGPGSEQQRRQQQQQQAEEAARPPLKRDRSKVYAPAAKRREGDGVWDARGELALQPLRRSPQPAHSGSDMQQGSASEGGTPPQQLRADSGGSADSGRLNSQQRRTIMQRTKAALQLWKTLRSNASTPSTVGLPPGASGGLAPL